ncbi:uncharacterized protein LOC132556525 [Ylistrum balloti]|uniref:uncharacterized protein LOC132556525 n=1 Tax=Ylistrum balloti TaxID=509963 RepID=UPI002905D734|nr:uncharacterized protein LOC132556525 [Ylistrum balloti]
MANFVLGSVFVFLHVLGTSFGGDSCYEYSFSLGRRTYYAFCENGCCGYQYDRECCDDDGWVVGIIIGCVVGGIIFLSLVASCIICLVCMTNKKGNRGRVIAPLSQQQETTSLSFVSNNTSWAHTSAYPQPQPIGNPTAYSQYGQPMGQFPQPPSYEQLSVPSTAPPKYPSTSEIYESSNHLPPIGGIDTYRQQSSSALPPIGHRSIDTSTM